MKHTIKILLKIFLGLSISIILLGIVLLVAFPTIISQPKARELLISTINKNISGTVSLEKLSISWLGNQKAHGLKIYDNKGKKVLTLKEADISLPLTSFISKKYDTLKINIVSPYIDISAEKLKSSLKHQQVDNNHSKSTSIEKSFLHIKPLNVSITDGFFSISSKEQPPFILDNINAQLNYPSSSEKLLFTINADLQHKKNGSIDISGEIGIPSKIYNIKDLTNIDTEIKLTNMPTQKIEELLQLYNPKTYKFLNSFENEIDIIFNAHGLYNDQIDINLYASCDNFKTSFNGKLTEGYFKLLKPSKTNLYVNEALKENLNQIFSLELTNPINAELIIEELTVPPEFFNISLASTITVPELSFYYSSDKPEVYLEDFVTKISTDNLNKNIKTDFDGKINGTIFKTSAEFEAPLSKTLQLSSPLKVNILPNTKTLEFIGIKNLKISDAFPIDVTINPFKIPLTSKDVNNLALSGNTILQKIVISDPITNISSDINQLAVEFNVNLPDNTAIINIAGNKDESHDIAVKAKVQNFIKKNKIANLSEIDFDADLNIINFPVIFIDLLTENSSHYKGYAKELFGSHLNVMAQTYIHHLDGSIFLNIKSDKSSLQLDGKIKNNTLTLQKPFTAELKVDQELSESILSKINPLLSSAINSKEPASLMIEDEKFSLPLKPFNLKKVNIEKGSFNLGKLQALNKGSLSLLINLLKLQDKHHNDQLVLWFTPTDFKLTEGTIYYDRTDILVDDDFQISSWGSISLTNGHSDLRIALPSATLDKAFDLENLPSDYMMQIPIKNKNNSLNIDWNKASSRILTLIAQEKGGNTGKILGGFLGAILDPNKEEEPPIPQLKYPKPWEIENSN